MVRTMFQADPSEEEAPMGGMLIRREQDGTRLEEPGIALMAIDPMFVSSEDQKDELVKIFQRLNSECDSLWCFFSTRAWASKNKSGRPSEDPKKEEVKIVSIEHRNEGTKAFLAKITKEGDKNVLGEFEPFTAEGRFINSLFDRQSN